ncbi:hypothetical protein [Nostoc sp.]|uniref:hypothetical protein n=1 Tax=Nostoc sp. TaxID=1180 RepID=UPI002FF4CFFC
MTFVLSYRNIFNYLVEHGFCTQLESALYQVKPIRAKNFNLLLTLPDSRKLLIKQERHNREGKTAGEFLSEWRIQEFLQTFPELSCLRPWVPEVLHFEAEHSIIVFSYLDDYRDLADFYGKEKIFPTQIVEALATVLATIHRATFNRQEYQEFFSAKPNNLSPAHVPNWIGSIERIEPEIFGLVPADGLKFFKLYQRYESLRQAIREIADVFQPCCLTHKDLDYASSLTPEVLHFDNSNSILIYKCPNNYITLQSFYENQETFPIAIAELVGTTLAKLHSQTMSSQECYTFLTELEECKLKYQLPYPDYLSDYLVSRIEPESLKKTQALSWRFLGIFQQSEAVREIVTELVLNHRRCCLTHNNSQFHKIFIPRYWEKLVSENQDSYQSLIKIIDWEGCSWGDPACDLGKAILGYFLFWLNSMIVHPAIDIKKSIQLATIPLEVIRTSIVAMTKAYINTYPKILEDYPDFLKRVIQYAGLGLIYQLLTEFQLQLEMALNHQNLYFFIAAQLLCKPEKFLSI